jgi:hypothetical protein
MGYRVGKAVVSLPDMWENCLRVSSPSEGLLFLINISTKGTGRQCLLQYSWQIEANGRPYYPTHAIILQNIYVQFKLVQLEG